MFAAAAAKSLQSCPTLYDPIDSSPPGSPVPGILQARILEWVAIVLCLGDIIFTIKFILDNDKILGISQELERERNFNDQLPPLSKI